MLMRQCRIVARGGAGRLAAKRDEVLAQEPPLVLGRGRRRDGVAARGERAGVVCDARGRWVPRRRGESALPMSST